MRLTVYEVSSGDILGTIVTNRSMTLDGALRIIGFEYQYWEQHQTEGWSNDNGETIYDSSDIETEADE